MTRRRAHPVPASIAAVAHIATQAQTATGRTMTQTELCELLTQARELALQHAIQRSTQLPTHPTSIRWTPTAFAHLKGLTGPAADLFTHITQTLQNQDTP